MKRNDAEWFSASCAFSIPMQVTGHQGSNHIVSDPAPDNSIEDRTGLDELVRVLDAPDGSPLRAVMLQQPQLLHQGQGRASNGDMRPDLASLQPIGLAVQHRILHRRATSSGVPARDAGKHHVVVAQSKMLLQERRELPGRGYGAFQADRESNGSSAYQRDLVARRLPYAWGSMCNASDYVE